MARVYRAAQSSLSSPPGSPRVHHSTASRRRSPALEHLLSPEVRMVDADGLEPQQEVYLPSTHLQRFSSELPSPLGSSSFPAQTCTPGYAADLDDTASYEPAGSAFSSPVVSPWKPATSARGDGHLDNHQPSPHVLPGQEEHAGGELGTSEVGDSESSEEQYLMRYGIPLPGPMTDREMFSSETDPPNHSGDAWFDGIFMDPPSNGSEERHRMENGRTQAVTVKPKEAPLAASSRSSSPGVQLLRSEGIKENCEPPDRSVDPRTKDPFAIPRRVLIRSRGPEPDAWPKFDSRGHQQPKSAVSLPLYPAATRFQPMKTSASSSIWSPAENVRVKTENLRVKAENVPPYSPAGSSPRRGIFGDEEFLVENQQEEAKGHAPSPLPGHFMSKRIILPPSLKRSRSPLPDGEHRLPVRRVLGRRVLGELPLLPQPKAFCREAEGSEFRGL